MAQHSVKNNSGSLLPAQRHQRILELLQKGKAIRVSG